MNIQLTIHLSVEDVEADGTNCEGCGDPVFFRASGIRCTMKGQLPGSMMLGGQFCHSCAEILKENLPSS